MPKLLGTEWEIFQLFIVKMKGVTALCQHGLVPCPCLLGPEAAPQSGSERGLAPGSRGEER